MALKEVINPHTGQKIRFGRIKPRVPRMAIKLSNYLMSALPAPPTACSYSKAALPVLHDVMLNDQYGDCGIAGAYHIVGVETGNAGALFHATKSQIIADYSKIGGFDPNHPDTTDNGIVLADALNYYQSHGFANGTKLLGSCEIDATNLTESKQAFNLAENGYLGMDLPDKWIGPFPSKDGDVWDVAGDPDLNNGHCVPVVEYNATGPVICTWGILVQMTWAAYAKYAGRAAGGEVYIMFTPDQLAKGQTTAPNGVDWITLLGDFNALGAHIPIPAPAPAPTPQPAGPVTLAVAKAALKHAFAASPSVIFSRSQAELLAEKALSGLSW